MAEMPDTVEQQLMFCTGYAGKETYYDVTNPLIIKVGESAEELRQRLVGPYIDLNYSCKSKNPKCTAKVYTDPDCTTQTKDFKITVKSDLDQSLLMCCSYWPEITANKAGTYYIKFTAESASKVIKVVVS